MDVKTSYFAVMSEVQKDPEDVFAGIGEKIYKVLNKFSCNLRSKSARSTLTSPGPIRVNNLQTLSLNPPGAEAV
jgi:hypothetical protein